MAQLAIKGHPTKGTKVIEILRMLGGINTLNCAGLNEDSFYYIGKSEIICRCCMTHNRMVFTLEEFIEKFPYKVGDKVQHKGETSCGTVYVIERMNWTNTNIEYEIRPLYDYNHTGLVTICAEDLQPYKEETKEEKVTIQDIRDNNAKWFLNKLQEMSAESALQTISDLYDELKKPQYPKTYVECCEIVVAQHDRHYFYNIRDKKDYPHEIKIMDCLDNLRRLIICRDAYWKIAGKQMGLGKPWKPDWGNDLLKYYISFHNNKVDKGVISYSNKILAFPTEEMRDTFYENFKKLIEACKELL